MARHGIIKPLDADIKPEKVFEVSQAVFKSLGWEVYKIRQIAFLVEARTTIDDQYILGNIITKIFGNPEINIIVKSDTASQKTVEGLAENILAALEKALAAKK
jgi:hypothetical protein